MDSDLARIRDQISSKLDNQKQIAITLQAVEETLVSQNQPKIASAYFSILLVLLEQDEGNNRASILYLLDIVLPHVLDKILLLKLKDIVNIFEIVLDEEVEQAPIVKSCIGCLEHVIKMQEKGSWSQPMLKKIYQLVLNYTVDNRPKVRRRAHLACLEILRFQPAPIAFTITSDFCLAKIKIFRKQASNSNNNEMVPFLQFVKSIIHLWPSDELIKLNQVLFLLPKINNSYITPMVYNIFSIILTYIDEDKVEDLLKNLIQLKPNSNETETMQSWLLAIQNGYIKIFESNPNKIFKFLPKTLTLLLSDLDGSNNKVNLTIGLSLKNIVESVYKVWDELNESEETILVGMFDQIQDCLSYRYRLAWPHLFVILASFYKVFGPLSPSAVIPTLQLLDGLRLEEEFQHKEELNMVVGQAITSVGVRRFLTTLPLNLENPNTHTVGRAWLLPLLKDYVINADLSMFCNEFASLAQRLTVKAEGFEKEGKEIEAKIYHTLAYQIWSLFPSFANFPQNFIDGFTSKFAELVANQLYNSPELRPHLFNGLALLVETNRRLVPDTKAVTPEACLKLQEAYNIDAQEAQQNLNHIQQFATNYLAVFFNVYTTASDQLRPAILNTILSFLTITSKKQTNETFQKVLSVLEADNVDEENTETTLATMIDLTLVMVPYLSDNHLTRLFQVATGLITKDVTALQKRGYKVLNKLVVNSDSKQGKSSIQQLLLTPEFEDLIVEAGLEASSAATKDRLNFLLKFVPKVQLDQFHLLSKLTSEVILGTKEVNEKAREISFELLVLIANRMATENGTIIPEKLGIQRDGLIQANLKEFMMMVVAGLTGTTPHMISATINALSRLLFEFHLQLEDDLIYELINTIELFVSSNNREIVKASLGFVKVVTVTLTSEQLEPHLSMVLTNILKWSNDIQSKFKVKVRHIIERLIRKFGIAKIEHLFPEEHIKLINNIRKRKLRAKRQSKEKHEVEQESNLNVTRTSKVNAFEDAIYGSESEIESDDDGKPTTTTSTKRKARAMQQTFIKDDTLDDDAPMDFLNRNAVSRITTNKPKSKINESKSNFQTDSFGKLVFKDEDSDLEPTKSTDKDNQATNPEDFYMQSIQSKDGYDRVNNKIKFKKGSNNKDDFDLDDSNLEARQPNKKPKGGYKNLGQDYSSKKAKGDTMKAGKLDPYAYVPLNPKMVPRKGKKAEKLHILKN